MTVAEVCISVVGLELAFAAAPAAMKTFMTACWLLAIFVGNFANGFITPLYNTTFLGISLTPDWYFLWFAVAMVPVTLAFVLCPAGSTGRQAGNDDFAGRRPASVLAWIMRCQDRFREFRLAVPPSDRTLLALLALAAAVSGARGNTLLF